MEWKNGNSQQIYLIYKYLLSGKNSYVGVWENLYVRAVASNLWVATPLGVALIFSGAAVTRHMLAVLVQVRCA